MGPRFCASNRPSPLAGRFEDDLLEEGFVLVQKENPEDMVPKEYMKSVAGASDTYMSETYIFVLRE
jgi:hypothetical protein